MRNFGGFTKGVNFIMIKVFISMIYRYSKIKRFTDIPEIHLQRDKEIKDQVNNTEKQVYPGIEKSIIAM